MGVPLESNSSPPPKANHNKKMVDIGGYMIMLAEMKNKKIKLYGKYSRCYKGYISHNLEFTNFFLY